MTNVRLLRYAKEHEMDSYQVLRVEKELNERNLKWSQEFYIKYDSLINPHKYSDEYKQFEDEQKGLYMINQDFGKRFYLSDDTKHNGLRAFDLDINQFNSKTVGDIENEITILSKNV